MAANFTIDDKLITEALRIGRYKTKKEAVTTALGEKFSAGSNGVFLNCKAPLV